MAISSARLNTFPVGLLGLFSTIARVRSLNAAASSVSFSAQSGSCKVT